MSLAQTDAAAAASALTLAQPPSSMGCANSTSKPSERPAIDTQAQNGALSSAVNVTVAPVPSVSASASGGVRHRPLIVCGPSGVGKGTLLTRLLKDYPNVFAKSVSHTTRAPRSGEVQGVSYHFTTPAELLAGVAAGQFIEHANVHGNFYGQSVAAVAAVMDTGRICLLEIDIQGVIAVRAQPALNPLGIFVRAPTFGDLVDRLKGRGTESAETLEKRLDTARAEMDFFYTNRHVFEADIINDEFEASYQRMIQAIKTLYPTLDLKQAPATKSAL